MTKFEQIGCGVRRRFMGALLGMSVAVGSVLVPTAMVEADSGDQERALRALKAGEVLPLRTMLDEVESRFMGDILEVELDDEKEDGRRFWIYKIKLISPDGDVIKLRLDAKTKEILQIKGRGADKARRK